jgi:hypothetical protein
VPRRRRGASNAVPPVPRVALIDANVFFSPRMRDLVMQLRELEIIQIHWTKTIEDEWTRNVVEKQGADPEGIQACLAGMRDATDGDWEVQGYERYEDQFEAVDSKDRHVAAAAHKLSLDNWPGQPVALVTRNIRDFPQAAFDTTEVKRYSMAQYLESLCAEEPELVIEAIELCRTKLREPPFSKAEYVTLLVRNGCQSLAETMAALWRVDCPSLEKDGTLKHTSETKAVKAPKRAKRARRKARN